ncbi:TRAP transporter substrate-binding protein [Rhodohalobacter sulfatireducens]|uniref:TRAP transporter substrate-binding protein n=1 Tax=Rhodohalobacter sulfatireducens TaxID=2911366 RepID=A0ABS9KHK4_9BACT|nr:TRAP transporter substrate-binding protein [Rhodohalobacter sulfatireducens]MCG2590295.1 TRAP transporter substrate-binding protein [Rhodohalobacter sulfatireducens]
MRRSVVIYLIAIFLFASSCGGENSVTVLKLGHGLDSSHSVHKAMVFMAERVEEESNGKMRIDIYPSQQLGSERELLELLQIGSLDITKVSSSVLEGFEPLYKIFSVPFLFQNEEHRFSVYDGQIGRELLDAGQSIRLVGLTYYDAGTRSFYTKDRPILHPDDLQGMKIRVQESPASLQMVNMLGGSATPISFGELYTALQQRIVDGAENNPPSLYLTRHYEVVDYYSLDEHTAVPDMLFASQFTWERLTDGEKEILRNAAQESAIYQRKLWEESTNEAMEAVQEAGIEVVRPDKEPFREKLQPMYDEYAQNEELNSYIQRIEELANE